MRTTHSWMYRHIRTKKTDRWTIYLNEIRLLIGLMRKSKQVIVALRQPRKSRSQSLHLVWESKLQRPHRNQLSSFQPGQVSAQSNNSIIRCRMPILRLKNRLQVGTPFPPSHPSQWRRPLYINKSKLILTMRLRADTNHFVKNNMRANIMMTRKKISKRMMTGNSTLEQAATHIMKWTTKTMTIRCSRLPSTAAHPLPSIILKSLLILRRPAAPPHPLR